MHKWMNRLIGLLFLGTLIYLLLLLYYGGNIGFLGVRKAEISKPVICLSVLILLRYLLDKQKLPEASVPLVLFCCFHILYMANFKTIWATDTVPARYLPFSILREGDLDLDEFQNLYSRGFVPIILHLGSHYVSSYPIGAPILATPFYVFSAAGPVTPNSGFVLDLEKLSAASLVALSAILVYFVLIRWTGRRAAIVLTILYALGTNSFSMSSQALWQHGASQLMLAAAIYCLVRGETERRWIGFAGFPTAFSVVCRPTNLLIAAPISLYVLVRYRKLIFKYVLFALPVVILYMSYNFFYFRDPAHTQFKVQQSSYWVTPIWRGLPAILLSPGRGLLFYSPFFIFAFAGLVWIWRNKQYLLLRYLTVGVIATLVMYSCYYAWWGGYSYGPRMLADITPILTLCIVPVVPFLRRSKFLLYLFLFFGAFSIFAHANGAYFDDGVWNRSIQINKYPTRAWYWTNNQLVNTPKRWINRIYMKWNHIPTSLNSPEALQADFTTSLPPDLVLSLYEILRIRVEANNTGNAVWLSTPNRGEGTVRLKWVWRKAVNNRVQQVDSIRVLNDVFPGGQTQIDLRIVPPAKTDKYIFEMCVVRFPDSEISPVLRIPVRIVEKK
jgi:hypothetical protein